MNAQLYKVCTLYIVSLDDEGKLDIYNKCETWVTTPRTILLHVKIQRNAWWVIKVYRENFLVIKIFRKLCFGVDKKRLCKTCNTRVFLQRNRLKIIKQVFERNWRKIEFFMTDSKLHIELNLGSILRFFVNHPICHKPKEFLAFLNRLLT